MSPSASAVGSPSNSFETNSVGPLLAYQEPRPRPWNMYHYFFLLVTWQSVLVSVDDIQELRHNSRIGWWNWWSPWWGSAWGCRCRRSSWSVACLGKFWKHQDNRVVISGKTMRSSPLPSPVARHPSPVTRHPSPVARPSPITRHPSLVFCHSTPADRHPSPVTRHPYVTCHPSHDSRHRYQSKHIFLLYGVRSVVWCVSESKKV